MCTLKGFTRFVVSLSKIDSFFKLSRLNTTVLRKVISFSDISAVNLMVGWNLLACSINWSTSFLSPSQREKISSIYRLHSFGLVSLRCISVGSILAMKILANDTALLVTMAVPFVWR